MSNTEAQIGALTDRLFAGATDALELLCIHVGMQLGLYTLLWKRGPSTVGDVAREAGIHERYAQEWLEQQAIAELIDVDDVAHSADARRYSLSEAQAAVLADETSLAYVAPAGGFLVSFGAVMHQLLDAIRTGGGVPYGDYGAEMREAQAAFNRPAFTAFLTSEWLPGGAPDLHDRLSQPGARILDVGCGFGWSTIALGRGYPDATVIGLDADGPSIEAAQRNAKEAGLDDQVSFIAADAADPRFAGQFDAAFIFEAVHDLSRPVDVLRAIGDTCKADGTVIVMDEKVADEFGAIGDPIERFMYAVSVVHCLPAGMADQPSAGTGTAMRASTLKGYAADAGFASADVLDIDNDLFRFYRLGKG